MCRLNRVGSSGSSHHLSSRCLNTMRGSSSRLANSAADSNAILACGTLAATKYTLAASVETRW